MVGTSRTNLIVADTLFVLVSGMIYETDGLKTYPIILGPLLVVAFVTCIIRHVHHYHMTNKIY